MKPTFDPSDSMNLCESTISDAQSWRRQLHCHPELAYAETRTADFIAERLTEFGLEVHRGLAGTGVVGSLRRGDGPILGLRADMDALPLTECTNVPHQSSIPGVMHACGHDGHMAILLAAARRATELENIRGTVHFIFQPAEENECGGKRMLEDGLFELFPCDEIFALHNWPEIPLGTCVIRPGPMMAALSTFEIILSGEACHAAFPHQGTDVLLAASQVHAALQSIVSRNIDASQQAIISVTSIHGGSTWNALPANCTLRGTTRWFDETVGDILRTRVIDIATKVAEALGCESTVTYATRIPPTINDPVTSAFLRNVVSTSPLSLTVLDRPPSLGSEDFAFMLNACRGSYILLGSGSSDSGAPLHSPAYDFNDNLIPVATQMWVELIVARLPFGGRAAVDR